MIDQSIDLDAPAMTNLDCVIAARALLATWLAPGDYSNEFINKLNEEKRTRALYLLNKVLGVR